MQKTTFALLVMLVLVLLVGCTLLVGTFIKPPEITITSTNQTAILSTLAKNTCKTKSLTLYTTPLLERKAVTLTKACGGIPATLTALALVKDEMHYYAVLENGTAGWVNSSFIHTAVCEEDANCSALNINAPFCNAGICVECMATRDCTGSKVCKDAYACVDCLNSSDCVQPGKAVCNTAANTCVICLQNSDCPEKKPYCLNATLSCVECRDNYDCNETSYCASGMCKQRR
ncbi:MAG: hypothetical protein V1725_03670 [archaeon]